MKHVLILCSLLAIACGLCQAQAAWQTDGVPVCTASGDQQNPVIVPDMKGGGIIVWQDNRSGNLDIYAQRVDSSGNRLWVNNGVAIATSGEMENEPRAISDMRGGAIVVFNKGDYNIWMQRVDSSGNVCWGANGKAMCDNDSLQMSYQLCSDSAGGVIIAWANADTFATGLADWDAYAQRVDSSGNLLWGTSGIVIANGTRNQYADKIIEDTHGGCIIYWRTTPTSFDVSLYAIRVNMNGSFVWPTSVPLCTLPGERGFGDATIDQSGGGIAVWYDLRNSALTKGDIYAQRIDSSGNVIWQTNGVPVCTDSAQQDVPVICADDSGSVVLSWYDTRGVGGTSTQGKIYAQKLDSNGANIWPLNGIAVCIADSPRSWPGIVTGRNTNTIISWFDDRNGNWDIYAQCLNRMGTGVWDNNGISVCSATNTQFNDIYARSYQSIFNGYNSAILVWHDFRNGNYDIYAQKLHGLTGVAGEPADKNTIHQSWLRVAPNPFVDHSMVSGIAKNVEIRIYDIAGRLVERTKAYTIGKNLTAGVYLVTAPGYKTAKMIKLK